MMPATEVILMIRPHPFLRHIVKYLFDTIKGPGEIDVLMPLLRRPQIKLLHTEYLLPPHAPLVWQVLVQ